MTAAELAELDRMLPLTDDDSLCQMQSLLWIARADLIDAAQMVEDLRTMIDELRADVAKIPPMKLRLSLIEPLARKLAEKCVRGKCYCAACGATNYERELIHNPGCAVTELENLTNG